MSAEERWSFLQLLRVLTGAAGALFIFGGSLAYFVRMTAVVYFSHNSAPLNSLWNAWQGLGG